MTIILTLFTFLHFLTIDHDVSMAIFQIYQESDQVHLEITFDTKDLAEDLTIDESNISTIVLKQYLKKNTSFKFDGKVNDLKVDKIMIVGDHLRVECVFRNELRHVKKLEIVNTCLLNIDKQSNIIQLDLNGSSKDFRMHKDRKIITIDF